MRSTPLVLTAVLLWACNQEPPRQQKMSDAELRMFHSEMPGMTEECLEKLKWGGVAAIPKSDDQCFKMLPRMRWRGLWRDQFEGELFCPEPARECPAHGSPQDGIFMDLNPRPPGIEKDPIGAVYAVEFIGRRTAQGSPMNARGYAQEMFVDRLISIRQVEPPPPQPTEKEMMEEMIREEAGGNFIPNAETKRQMQDYLRRHPRREKK